MDNGNKTVKQIVEEMQNDWAQSLVAKAREAIGGAE